MPQSPDVVVAPVKRLACPANPTLDFVLAGYLNPKAKPGDVPTPEEAQLAMEAMRKRARFQARLCGAARSEAANDGLSQAFLELGRSKLLVTYKPTPRGVRPYVNRVIGRKVGNAAASWRASKAIPPEWEPQSSAEGPDRIVEVNELTNACVSRLHELDRTARINGSGCSQSAAYSRKHRAMKCRKTALRSLFPEFNI